MLASPDSVRTWRFVSSSLAKKKSCLSRAANRRWYAKAAMGRSAVNILARRVARRAWESQRSLHKSTVSEQAAGTGLARPDAQVSKASAFSGLK